jgi:hypothetical protein
MDAINLYAYVLNNPLRFTDPDGLIARTPEWYNDGDAFMGLNNDSNRSSYDLDSGSTTNANRAIIAAHNGFFDAYKTGTSRAGNIQLRPNNSIRNRPVNNSPEISSSPSINSRYNINSYKVYVNSRHVYGSKGIASHTYVSAIGENNITIIGGSYNQNGQNKFRYNNENLDHVIDRVLIPPPFGMPPKTWYHSVKSAMKNRNKRSSEFYALGGSRGGTLTGNCHTTTRGIIEDAGGSIPIDFNPSGINPDLHGRHRNPPVDTPSIAP